MTSVLNMGRRTTIKITKRQQSCRAMLTVASAGIAAALMGRAVHAAAYVFDPGLSPTSGTDGSGNWDTVTPDFYNVSGAVLGTWSNSTADTAIFGAGTTGTPGVVTVAATGVNVGTLNFANVSGYTLSGGPITFGAAGTINFSTGISATIGSNIAGAATSLTINGGGNLTLTGTNTYTGSTIISGATVNFTGAGSSLGNGILDVGNAVGSTTVLNFNSTGTYNFSNGVNAADNALNSAAINLTSGTLNLENPAGSYVGIGNGGYAALAISGSTTAFNVGTSGNSTGLRIGTGSTTAIGVFTQSGGNVVLQRYLAIANNGTGEATFTGGTITVLQTRSLVGDSVNDTSVLNLGTQAGGTSTFSTTLGLELQDTTAASGSSTTNLNSGTLILGSTGIYQGVVPTGTAKVNLNLNGATIVDATTGATVISNADSLAGTVFNGGATFNISGSAITDTINANLVGTTGNGIYKNTTFAPTAGTLGSGYIGAPFVAVSGGSGTGATAIANVSGGSIVGFTMTSPGQGYLPGDVLSFTLSGGGATTAASGDSYTLQSGDLTANNTGGLTKIGTGILVLTGTNTYGGPTAINLGELNAGSTGAIPAASKITFGGGTLQYSAATKAIDYSSQFATTPGQNYSIDTNAQTITFATGLTGSTNSLTKLGSGTLTLTAPNTYLGATTVGVGTLVIAPTSSLSNTAISVANGAVLAPNTSSGSMTFGSGTASLAVVGGGTLNLIDNAIGTLNLVGTAGSSALTLGSATGTTAAAVKFDLGGTVGSNDTLAVTGNASVLASGAALTITPLSTDTSLAIGSYTLITAGGGLASNISLAAPSATVNSVLYDFSLANSTPTAEILTVSLDVTPPNAYWAGTYTNNWNTSSPATNFLNGNPGTPSVSNVGPNTNVFFTASTVGVGGLNTVLGANFAINSLTFNGLATGPVAIGGANTLTLEATSANGNALGNGINLSSGSTPVTISASVVLGAPQTWTNNATNTLLVSGNISGGVSLTTAGTGVITLSGNNSYSGGLNASSGQLNVNSPTALGTGTFTTSGPFVLDNTTAAPLVLTTNNPQSWQSSFTFNGTNNLNMGSGAVTLTGNRTVTLNANTLSVGGVTDGGIGYSLTVNGNGNLAMLGANSYFGATSIQGGSISFVGTSGSSGNGTLDLSPTAGLTSVLNVNTTGNVSFGSTVNIADAALTGSGTLNGGSIGAINQSNGTLNLLSTGGNTYVNLGNGGYGAFLLSGGTLNIGTTAFQDGIRIAYGTGSVGVFLQTGGTFTSNRYVAIASGNGAAGAGGYGIATFTGGTTTLVGYRTSLADSAGSVGTMNLGTLAGGTNVYNTGGNGGLVIANGPGATGTLNLDSGTLNLSQGSIYQGNSASSVVNGNTVNASATVNFDGATILAGASNLTLVTTGIATANVYNGGANFNVPTGTVASITQNLSATTGNGIYAQGSGGTFAVTGNTSVGYVGSPIALVTGGSGTGATAIANLTNGVVTGITMTNPGQNYVAGDNLTFVLTDGGFNTTASNFNYTLTSADIAVNNGGFTKTGGGSLTVSGSNTYTGNTQVKGGTLVIANTNALGPTGSAIMSTGTTLALGTNPQLPFTNFVLNTNGVYTPSVAAGGASIVLTTSAGQEATSAFDPTAFTISDVAGFSASFTYTHTNTGTQGAGADGIAFTVQSQGSNALGAAGGALGYTSATTSVAGITPSVAALVNEYYDQIEIGTNGTFNTAAGATTAAGAVPSLSAYATSNVTFTYNGPTQTLTETITSPSNGSSTSVVLIGVDVASLLGGTAGGTATAYIGFTGATGGVSDTQSISNFSFNNTSTTSSSSSSAINITNGVQVTAGSSSIIQLASTSNYSSGSVGPITIGSGSTLAISIGSTPVTGVTKGVLTTPSITFSNASSGTLDIGKNALDINSQTIGTVTAMVASAYKAGNWTGPGITSTAAAADTTHLTAVGVILNTVNGTQLYGSGTSLGLFDGASPGSSDVLVKYTYYGDTDLSGVVDGTDYSHIDNAFANNKTAGPSGQLTGWFNGDFNYDGVINGSDYTLMDNAFNRQGVSLASAVAQSTALIAGSASGASAVPEPATLAIAGIGAIGLLSRRRRRAH